MPKPNRTADSECGGWRTQDKSVPPNENKTLYNYVRRKPIPHFARSPENGSSRSSESRFARSPEADSSGGCPRGGSRCRAQARCGGFRAPRSSSPRNAAARRTYALGRGFLCFFGGGICRRRRERCLRDSHRIRNVGCAEKFLRALIDNKKIRKNINYGFNTSDSGKFRQGY